jgi:thiol-disulfide isomerase/thioredoxin
MKIKLNSLILLLSISFLVLSGCKNKPSTYLHQPNVSVVNESKQPNTRLHVKIENSSDPAITITSGFFSDTVQLNTNGLFETSFHLVTDGYFSLRNGSLSIRIFLAPGDNLTVKFNASDAFNTITFSGEGQLPNQYLKEKYDLMLQQAFPLEQLFERPALQFKQIIDSLYIVRKIALEEFMKQHSGLSPFFISCEQASLLYDRASQLNEFAIANPEMSGSDAGNYFIYLKNTDSSDINLLEVYEYQLFLDSRLTLIAKDNLGVDRFINSPPEVLALEKQKAISQLTKNPIISDYLLHSVMSGYIRSNGFNKINDLIDYFEHHCTDTVLKNQLLAPYQKYIRLKHHPLAPAVSFVDINGKEFSLADFRGQYIYIDVWASWCLPCRRESPLFDTQKEKYQHKNIAFISLSIDDKTADWKGFLNNRKTFINQYLVKNVEKFADDYQIRTIPRFLIISPDGILLDEDAVRPSENKTGWIDSLPDREKPSV